MAEGLAGNFRPRETNRGVLLLEMASWHMGLAAGRVMANYFLGTVMSGSVDGSGERTVL